MDVVFLSRIQFALNITFHYLFPPMSIGLGLLLVIMEGMYMKTKNHFYKKLAQFWTKIFALFFAVGVATGFVQVFAFGNNWADYSKFVGDVFGTVLAAEGIFAFFLEAGFLGIMLFGWERVKPRVHYLSTILVTFGAHFSAIWIVIANSWMQTPTGYQIVGSGRGARAVVTNIWEVYFNPSSMDRLAHVLIGCWITGSFLLISIGAYYLLKRRSLDFAKVSLKVGLIIGSICLILQLISADVTARGVAKNQPVKLAAMEGVYKTKEYTPMTLLGFVDSKEKKVVGIKVPGLLSFLTFRDFKQPVQGLDQFDQKNWPNISMVFQSYHIMIYAWVAMAILAILAWIFVYRKKLEERRWLLWLLTFAIAFPYIANTAGWFTAELGRQPWLVYNVLRTSEGVSRSIVANQVIGSLIMFICIYIALFAMFIFLLNRKIKHGPEAEEREDVVYRTPFTGKENQ
ncbi:MAG: cytochrome ubiquinol oxidase subunit I [Simkaniaceae bacterium]|nr:cytochrome ubiquinol oxidase subunit I [Simkaniaceae bacterium]MCF7852028.1 cytochrome ubiquinol oxidase subunit I [Simkaniaceae bacterium]